GWRKAWRPVLMPRDIATARRLGTVLFFAETLDGAQVSLHLPRGSKRLHLTVRGGPGSEASERAVERLKKSMQRTFELDVVFHAG
ncbi:MAG: hypothetical protein L3J96_07280, partial [Thermoplasmata archaeon]|nr:hypothetical protein [Thermoplasmata archaeon]